MKNKTLILFLLLCMSHLFAEKYVYFRGGHNEFHIPIMTHWNFEEFHPGGSIGLGYPLIERKRAGLLGNIEVGYNNHSIFQDAAFVHALLSGEIKITDSFEYKLAIGAGGVFLIQKGVYNTNDNNEYCSFFAQPALQVTCQTGFRFKVPKTESFYLLTEYEMQLEVLGLNLPEAVSPVIPSSSICLGLLWKIGDKKNAQ